MGVGAEEVRRATSWEPTYQTALRGSARDPDNKNPKTIIVPDRPTAEFLRSLFPGSTLEKLPIDLSGVQPRPTRGRPKKHKNGTGRVQHHRALQDAHVRRVFDLIGTGVKMGPEDVAVPNSFQNTCNEITFKKGHLKNVTSFHRHSDPLDGRVTGSVFTDQYATDPLAIVNEEQEIFIKALRKAHRDIIAGKEDNLLFCPSVFDPTLSSETDRGLDNVLYANGVWLDFDGGDLTHKQLAAMFPFLRILVFNSYSSTKKLPRFRVYIPTNRIVSKEEYAFLTEQILQTVKDAGYRRKKKDLLNFGAKAHGIDTGKLHAASLFFLPCRPADPTGRIWKDFKGDGRAPLDVDDWALYAIPVEGDEPEPAPRDDVSGEWDEGRVARAVQRWDTKRTQAGMGDSELWILSQELSRAGVPRGEAQTILNDAARRASSPTERLKQARRIISTYRARTAA